VQPISSAKWKEIEVLLDPALDLPPSDRTLFLENASKDDPSLRKVLMELWEAGQKAESFLEEDIPAHVIQVMHQLSSDDAYGPAPSQGMRFGDYEVVEEIGRGGMSVVYKARRVDGQFDHTVALKILKRGMDTEQLVRRFKAERQILARLQHANIARLLDGGATDDGRPYLLMEYVKGIPITDYCDVHRLDINSRLALTLMEGRIMTPEYAAPEQIYGDPITTATDWGCCSTNCCAAICRCGTISGNFLR